MIVKEEFLSRLRRYFSLNLYEVKIWTALLSRGVSTAGELSDIANVPRSRSYDVLESLEKKGFVAMKLEKPIKYLAVPPKEVMSGVKRNIKKKTEKHLSNIMSHSFINLINILQETYESTTKKIGNFVAVLKGDKNIQKHLEFLFKKAKKTIMFSVENDVEKYIKLFQRTKNTTKSINRTLITNKEYSIQTSDINIKNQHTGVRLCVVDEDNIVFFPVREEDIHPNYDLGVWVKNKQTASFLKELFG